MTRILDRLGLDGAVVVGYLLLVVVGAALAACLPGCGPLPAPVCEPSSARCNGPDRVEICTPEGQWLVADRCSDFGQGGWECRAAGDAAACMPREIVEPR